MCGVWCHILIRNPWPAHYHALMYSSLPPFPYLYSLFFILHPLTSQYSKKGNCNDSLKLSPLLPSKTSRRSSTILMDTPYDLLHFAVAKGLTEIASLLLTIAQMATALDAVSSLYTLHGHYTPLDITRMSCTRTPGVVVNLHKFT